MKSDESKIGKWLATGLVVITLSALGLYFTTSATPFAERYKPIDELGGDFTLNSAEGYFSLADIRGKVGILYFGFLNCHDACPASISVVQRAYGLMDAEALSQVQFVYVSVDPERDTEQKLRHFSHMYDEDLVAVTGTKEQIDQVTDQYGVYFDIKDFEGNVDQYVVDHSSRFYLIDRSGKLVRTMSHSTTPIELAARLKEMLTTAVVADQSSDS